MKTAIVSDSIFKHVHFPQKPDSTIDVQCFPGATTKSLLQKLGAGRVHVRAYDIVIFHVGTNDIHFWDRHTGQPEDEHRVVDRMKQLTAEVKRRNPHCMVAFSTLLPRLLDRCDPDRNHPHQDCHVQTPSCTMIYYKKPQLLNVILPGNAGDAVVKTHAPFLRHGQPIQHKFRRDGLHPSHPSGTKALQGAIVSFVQQVQNGEPHRRGRTKRSRRSGRRYWSVSSSAHHQTFPVFSRPSIISIENSYVYLCMMSIIKFMIKSTCKFIVCTKLLEHIVYIS